MLGLKVAAHAHGDEGIHDAILAGIDTIEHASLASDATIQLAKQHGTWFDMDIYNDDYILAAGTSNGTEQESLDKEKAIGLKQRQTFQRAVRAGVKMLFGTDAGRLSARRQRPAVRQDGAVGNDPDPGDPGGDHQRLGSARPARCRLDPARRLWRHHRRQRRPASERRGARACRCGGEGRRAGERPFRAVSAPTTSTRTLVIALVANARDCRFQVRRGDDHRLIGDADRRRAQRGRLHQPAAADVGAPRGQAPARPHPSVRLRPRALFLELHGRGAGLLARRRACRSTKASSTSPIPKQAVSPIIAYVVLLVAFVLEGWSTVEAFKEFRAAKGELGWFEAIRHSKDPPAFIVLLENGAAMAGIIAAAIGLALSQLTGDPFFDGAASVVIGIDPRGHRIHPRLRIEGPADRRSRRSAAGRRAPRAGRQPGRGGRGRLCAHRPLLARSGDGDDQCRLRRHSITAADVERIVCEVETEAHHRWPHVRRLFIRPMQGAARKNEKMRRLKRARPPRRRGDANYPPRRGQSRHVAINAPCANRRRPASGRAAIEEQKK